MSISYIGEYATSPGVEKNLQPQNVEGAVKQATKEQAGEDIFKPQPDVDVDALVVRLNEIETECNELQMKVWGPPKPMDSYYKGPPYLERERLNHKLDLLYEEKYSIQAQLRQVLEANNYEVEGAAGPYTGDAKVLT